MLNGDTNAKQITNFLKKKNNNIALVELSSENITHTFLRNRLDTFNSNDSFDE